MKPYVIALLILSIMLSVSLMVCINGKAMAQQQQNPLVVNSCRMKKSTGYGEYLVAEAYVENLANKRANNINVKLIVYDQSGISAFDGTNRPRVYATYFANIPELAPGSAQWITISTAIANAQDINEGRRSFTLELAGPSTQYALTKVELQYHFEATAGSFSD